MGAIKEQRDECTLSKISRNYNVERMNHCLKEGLRFTRARDLKRI